jgi:hypothetical protein
VCRPSKVLDDAKLPHQTQTVGLVPAFNELSSLYRLDADLFHTPANLATNSA